MTNTVREFLSRKGRAVWSLLLFLAAFGLLVSLNANAKFRTPAGELGPDFWPRLWLTVLLVLSALDCVIALRGKRAPVAQPVAGRARPPENMRLVVAGIFAVAAYALAMNLIGFALATAIFFVAFAALGGYRNMRVLLSVALLTTIVLLYLFVQVVYISLPLGQGPFVGLNVLLYRLLGIF